MVKWIIRGAMLVLISTRLSYTAMTITARRMIAPSEYVLYKQAILRAAIGHADEGGEIRAVRYAQAALAHSLADDQIVGAVTLLSLPMPPHTIRQPVTTAGHGNHYVSFVTDTEFITYITQTLPLAGWMHVDQMGASHIFTRDTQQLIIMRRYLLSTARWGSSSVFTPSNSMLRASQNTLMPNNRRICRIMRSPLVRESPAGR